LFLLLIKYRINYFKDQLVRRFSKKRKPYQRNIFMEFVTKTQRMTWRESERQGLHTCLIKRRRKLSPSKFLNSSLSVSGGVCQATFIQRSACSSRMGPEAQNSLEIGHHFPTIRDKAYDKVDGPGEEIGRTCCPGPHISSDKSYPNWSQLTPTKKAVHRPTGSEPMQTNPTKSNSLVTFVHNTLLVVEQVVLLESEYVEMCSPNMAQKQSKKKIGAENQA
jgi:hypothetical protein